MMEQVEINLLRAMCYGMLPNLIKGLTLLKYFLNIEAMILLTLPVFIQSIYLMTPMMMVTILPIPS